MIDIDEYLDETFSKVERTRDDLHHYQADIAVPFLLENPFSALFVDLGLGKTVISLTVLADLLNSMSFEKALIIGPLRVVNRTWPDEIPMWEHTAPITWSLIHDDELKKVVRKAGLDARAPIATEARKAAIARGINPKDSKAINEVVREYVKLNRRTIETAKIKAARKAIREAAERNNSTIHLINREQVEFLVAAWGKDWPYDVVIIDESTSFKDHKTGRFKALKRVRPLIGRMHQLAATPTAEGYMGLFAMMYLLDQGERLGKSITAYRERYFVRGYDGYSWELRPGADEEITEKISDICLELKREDYMPELKEPIFNPRYLTLSAEEMRLYKEMERELVIELPGGVEIESESAAQLGSKLLQMASGCIYDDQKRTHPIHNHKIEELEQIVEEAQGEPLIVVYWFKSSLDRLKKAFPKAVMMDRDGDAVGPWNKRKIPMLLLHPQGAAHGLNLQYGGHHMVFFDIPWSLELYLQTIGRIDRQGQEHAVVLHHLIAKGTIEEDVIKALREKREVQEIFFRLLKRMRRKLGL